MQTNFAYSPIEYLIKKLFYNMPIMLASGSWLTQLVSRHDAAIVTLQLTTFELYETISNGHAKALIFDHSMYPNCLLDWICTPLFNVHKCQQSLPKNLDIAVGSGGIAHNAFWSIWQSLHEVLAIAYLNRIQILPRFFYHTGIVPITDAKFIKHAVYG
jgi:hypothetical protein